jgi:hypothetical protein
VSSKDRTSKPRATARPLPIALTCLVLSAPFASAAGREPTAEQKQKLGRTFAAALAEEKGPYTQNFCACENGDKRPVQAPDGRIKRPCGPSARVCAAFRAPPAEELAAERMYIANIFSRDLHLWDSFLFESDLADPTFDAQRHQLLASELQRRFFVRNERGDVQRIRNLAIAVYHVDPKVKPLRDATHDQLSAALMPRPRPFLGNDVLQNLPALAALDGEASDEAGSVSLDEKR